MWIEAICFVNVRHPMRVRWNHGEVPFSQLAIHGGTHAYRLVARTAELVLHKNRMHLLKYVSLRQCIPVNFECVQYLAVPSNDGRHLHRISFVQQLEQVKQVRSLVSTIRLANGTHRHVLLVAQAMARIVFVVTARQCVHQNTLPGNLAAQLFCILRPNFERCYLCCPHSAELHQTKRF